MMDSPGRLVAMAVVHEMTEGPGHFLQLAHFVFQALQSMRQSAGQREAEQFFLKSAPLQELNVPSSLSIEIVSQFAEKLDIIGQENRSEAKA